jgi:hypothetical protein
LTQKVNKKVKAQSASLKKLAFIDENRPNLFPPSSETSDKDDFSVASLVFWLTGQGRSNLHEEGIE